MYCHVNIAAKPAEAGPAFARFFAVNIRCKKIGIYSVGII